MDRLKYNDDYYSRTYGRLFVQRQQRLFELYLSGKGGFERRISVLFEFADNVIKGRDVLDLGCGIGTFALLFAQRGFNTIGLDISEESIRACERNKKKLKLKTAKFIRGNSSDDKFDRDSFDLIIAEDIIEHLPDVVLTKSLNNCYKWLRRGGSLIIHTFPTLYQYQTVTVASLSLLPLFVINTKHAEKYLKLLHYTLYNLLSAIVFKKGITKYILTSGHCNPPHPMKFRKNIMDAGFKIKEYVLLDLPLSVLKKNQPRFKFLHKLIRRHEVLKSSILVIAEKE